jgi:hypothetical protein
MHSIIPVSRRALVFVVALFLSGLMPAVAQPLETDDDVVELPQFLVTDTRELPPPESWRYARIPGFEILSNAGDRDAERLIRDFDLFRQALAVVWPLPERTHRPTMLILCGRRGAFDAFSQREASRMNMGSASVFVRNPEQAAIILDLQLKTLDVLADDVGTDPTGSTDFGLVAVEHNKQLYREYIYHLLSSASPRAPAWFEEGLAQLMMGLKFDQQTIRLGVIEDPNTLSASAAAVAGVNASGEADPDLPALPGAPAEDRDFNVALARRALVPFRDFFAVAHGDPETRNPLGNNLWAKQAYAFVHMCVFGRGGRYQQPFALFLQRLGRGEPVSEELFTECFKLNYKTMMLELRAYIQFTDYKAQGARAKKGEGLAAPASVEFREATQSEVGRIKGEALMLAGKTDPARLEMIAPYVRGERDPDLLAALGLLERSLGSDERARRFLEAAATESVDRPRVYLEVGRLRYLEAAAAPAGREGLLSSAQAEHILSVLRKGRTHTPPMPALYELVADTLSSAELVPDKEDLKMLIEGVNTFPRRSSLTLKAARLCARHGYPNEARELAAFGLRFATTSEQKAQFEAVRSSQTP